MKRRGLVIAVVIFVLVVAVVAGVCVVRHDDIMKWLGVSNSVTDAGSKFLGSAYKIKSTVRDLRVGEDLKFEVYVDVNGNGSGLMQYDEQVSDVGISGDSVFVEVNEATVVKLTEVTGHFVLAEDNVRGLNTYEEMMLQGFRVVDKVVGYEKTNGSVTVSSEYGVATNVFDAVSYSNQREATISELIALLRGSDTNVVGADDTASGVEGAQTTGEEQNTSGIEERNRLESSDTFYNDFNIGVNINGQMFSVGDKCNPTTYYFGLDPEGINQKYTYNQDKKITIDYVSYIDSGGRTVFSVVDGYVRSIYTTCSASWCGISVGMTVDGLNTYIYGPEGEDGKNGGYNGKGTYVTDGTQLEEEYKIPFEGLEVDNEMANGNNSGTNRNNWTDEEGLCLKIRNLKARIKCDGEKVKSIYVSTSFDFEGYEDGSSGSNNK